MPYMDQIDPNYDASFVNNLCQHNLPSLVLYYPILLLIIGGTLIVIDRPFVTHLFQSRNISEVYKNLVHEREIDFKNRDKEQVLLQSILVNSTSKYFASYFLRTILSMIL